MTRKTLPVMIDKLWPILRLLRRTVRKGEGGHEGYKQAGGCCGIVSEEIEMRYGWPCHYGTYRRKKDGSRTGHAWNYLPNGSILDATADQWEEGHDIRTLKPSQPDFKRYEENDDYRPGT